MASIRSSSAIQAVVSTFHKAPLTLSIFASYFVSQIVSSLWLDYRLFVSLPGGPLPKNVIGWSVHYFVLSPLSLHSKWTSGELVRSFLPRQSLAGASQLSTGVDLPPRQGARPITAGSIPHRQLDGFSNDPGETKIAEQDKSAEVQTEETSRTDSQEAIEHILLTLQKEADANPSHLRLGSSQIESRSTALFAVSHTLVTGSDNVSRSTRSAQFPSALSRRFLSSTRGEFVHIHCGAASEAAAATSTSPVDASLHVTLHPDDAASIVEQGWGELHPLAGFPSYSGYWIGWPAWLTQLRASTTRSARWWSSSSIPTAQDAKANKALGLPPSYCLIYSPRNMEEARIVHDIIRAATAFAIGPRPSSR